MREPGKVCVVAGVGPGNGVALTRRFAVGGYRVAMLARSAERLADWESEIAGARAYTVDISDRTAVESTFAAIKQELGPIDVLVHNAAAGAREEFLDLQAETLERTFKVNVLSLLHCGQLAARDMLERGGGAIVVTGNTAARRGMPAFAGFAPTKAAQRILAESMARSLGPRGIHVSYVIIDAVIDLPWTRKRMPNAPDDFFAKPDAIAETVWHLAHQEQSAWSFEVDLRPFGEKW
ncbi:MAG TPA: SDR family NAD(P)-dependent oxidoreductase [Thermoanaerobaculia bacterium]|jgi:NAD(P)-dependent dehydrogenase (short-subunit alcohol dehydrogenase family)|nr:SDR family NAD(P)-dependent oxidoreductase [Thermoanaerobaculia bacterium]